MAESKANPAKPPDAPTAAALAAEAEKLAAERRAFEEEKARFAREKATAKPPGPVVEAGPSTGYWQVEIPDGLTHTVAAPDAPNAWEVCKREMGILNTEQAPIITPTTKDVWELAQKKRFLSTEAIAGNRAGAA